MFRNNCTFNKIYASILSNIKKELKKMGLVTRRSEQLDKLFDQFAIDPKKPKATKKNDDKKEKDSKDKEKK